MMNSAELIPASVPTETESNSMLRPRRSAQRVYMRKSISAQSWASVPPAPDWMWQTASPSSYSPEKSDRTSRASSST